MILFKKKFILQIKAGKKDVTRRPVTDPNRRPAKPGAVHYARMSQFDKSDLQIYIKDVRMEKLIAITDAEARREGLRNRKEFLEIWDEIYGHHSNLDDVWVIDFELYEKYLSRRPTLEKWGESSKQL